MVEIWKNIPGIQGYQASSAGRIRSVARTVAVSDGKLKVSKRLIKARVLKACNCYQNGIAHYTTVSLNGKTRAVHRLVALAFLGRPPFGPKSEVNHKNGNRHDNSLRNLEWCTKQMNMDHAKGLKAKRLAKGITRAASTSKRKEKANGNSENSVERNPSV